MKSSPNFCEPVVETFGNNPDETRELMQLLGPDAQELQEVAEQIEAEFAGKASNPERSLESGAAATKARLACGRCAVRDTCGVAPIIKQIESTRKDRRLPSNETEHAASQLFLAAQKVGETSTKSVSANDELFSFLHENGINTDMRQKGQSLDQITVIGDIPSMITDASPVVKHDKLTPASDHELRTLLEKMVLLATTPDKHGNSQLFDSGNKFVNKMDTDSTGLNSLYELRRGGKARLYILVDPPAHGQLLKITIIGHHGNSAQSQESFLESSVIGYRRHRKQT